MYVCIHACMNHTAPDRSGREVGGGEGRGWEVCVSLLRGGQGWDGRG